MGQQASQAPPPPYEYKTDTTFDTFSIPEKVKPEFDDAILDHNEQVFSFFALAHTRIQTKATELKLRDFDELVPKEEYSLSDTEFLFNNVAMGQAMLGGNYECMKDWSGVDLLEKKFSAMERRKLVEDLRSCGKATFDGITDPNLQHHANSIEDYRHLCNQKESLQKFKHYLTILKDDQNAHLEDASDQTEIEFTDKDRNQMDEIVEKLKLQKTLKTVVGYGDNIVLLPPSFHVLAMQLMTVHCKRYILDCLQKTNNVTSNEEAINTTSVGDYQLCLFNSPCFSKLGLWLSEKMEADKAKK